MSEVASAADTSDSWWRKLASLAFFLVLVASVAALGAVFGPGAWYAALAKPPLVPPNWVFPVVWTTLYVMVAVAGWLLYESGPWGETRLALTAFGIQLALNGLWSPLFFGLQLPGVALLDIGLLWGAILATLILARAHSPAAVLLFVPYFLWVSFASYLNAGIWWLNR